MAYPPVALHACDTAATKLAVAHRMTCTRLAGQVADLATGVLPSLLSMQNFTSAAAALPVLRKLRPGLYGCAAMPRATDAIKPNSRVRDAAVRVFQQLDEAMQPQAVSILQDCVLSSPDKAPLRNMIAEASTSVASQFNDMQQASWLNFVSLALYSPKPGTRLLALQLLELMLLEVVKSSCAAHEQAVRVMHASALLPHNVASCLDCIKGDSVLHLIRCHGSRRMAALISPPLADRCRRAGTARTAAALACLHAACAAGEALRRQALSGVRPGHDGPVQGAGKHSGRQLWQRQPCAVACAPSRCAVQCGLLGAPA